jgi:signal transduction histidine kinase
LTSSDSLVARLRAWLPRGSSLSDDEWRRRHRVLLVVLWTHIAGLLAFGLATGVPVGRVALWTAVLCAPAALCTIARHDRAAWNSAAMSLALLTCTAVLISYWNGRIEAHFDFFVVVVLLTLYEEWLPFLIAAAYVALHHGILGVIDPADVYDHADAQAHPWRWALVHAAFIAAAGAAAIVAWRLNEDVRDERRVALERAVAAERALEASARELQESNTELTRFASNASHDLAEPLHTITGFMSLLERRYGDRLDDSARAYITHSLDGAARMQRLIDGLLHLSRLGREASRHEPTDLEPVMAGVLEALTARIASSGAQVAVGPLPVVLGDADRLAQALQNLLSNALKFSRPGEPPRVEIAATRTAPATWAITISDHGIGIPAEQRHRIFDMFHRVHGFDAYEGTGIGLAIVQRIVTAGGGSIDVSETPGGGSTFLLELPAGPDRAPHAGDDDRAAAAAADPAPPVGTRAS